MKTIIIPCASQEEYFGIPKWLLIHLDGIYSFEKALIEINLNEYDRIIFSILESHDKKFRVRKMIDKIYSELKIEYCVFTNPTNDPAETVYQTIVRKNVKGAVIIKDSDSFMSLPISPNGNIVCGVSLHNFPQVSNLKNKSYLKVNEQNRILDIVEKKVSSSIISVGLYGFEDADDFVNSYESLLTHFQDRYLYVSHIIAYLIGVTNTSFSFVEVDSFGEFFNEVDYFHFQQETVCIIVNLDKFIMSNNNIHLRNYIQDNLHTSISKLSRMLKNNSKRFVFKTSLSQVEFFNLYDKNLFLDIENIEFEFKV